MRFVVDHCVPAEVARSLASEGHEAWTAYDAGLADAQDEDLIAYAHAKGAVLVTTNRDCAQLARRLRSAAVVWLILFRMGGYGREEEFLFYGWEPAGPIFACSLVTIIVVSLLTKPPSDATIRKFFKT